MPKRRGSAALRGLAVTLLAAAGFAALAVVAKLLILNVLQVNAGFVIYIPAIAFAAWFRGLYSGLVTTVLGALADELLVSPPLVLLAIDVREEQVRLLAYLIGGASVSFLSHQLRAARDGARREVAARRKALAAEGAARAQLDRLVAGERRANELRDAFNSILSHELRSPITAIYGGAKLLARRERALDEPTRQELISDLEAEADRLYRLVEDLLVLARTERGTLEIGDEPILVARVAERVVQSEKGRWPGASFSVTVQGSVAAARGDDTYVEQVLRNLLSNAAKYTPPGAPISVVIDEAADGVRLRVLDDGAGIDPAEASLLFDLYYRSPMTSTSASGAGIGLFVCRNLVEAMGGRIWAARRLEGGAEFGFLLPRYEDENGVTAVRTEARAEPAASGPAGAGDPPPAMPPRDGPLRAPRPG